MIQSNELRCGNLIKALGDYYSVLGVECVDNLIEGKSLKKYEIPVLLSEFSTDNCLGIPLTEEWLLKLGFTCYDHSVHDYCYENDDIIVFLDGKIRGIEKPFMPIYRRDVLLPYVHQLQDLYFALTGKELTIQ